MVKKKVQNVPVHKTFTEVFDSLATSILDGKLKVENVFEYLHGHGKMHGIHFNIKFGISPEAAANNPFNRMTDNIKANYSLRANIHSEKLIEAKELIAGVSHIKRKYTLTEGSECSSAPQSEDDEEYISPLNKKSLALNSSAGKKRRGRKPGKPCASSPVASSSTASAAAVAATLADRQRRDEKWSDYIIAVRKDTVQLDKKGNLVYSGGAGGQSHSRSWSVVDSPNYSVDSQSSSSGPRLIYLGVLDIATQQKVLRDPVKHSLPQQAPSPQNPQQSGVAALAAAISASDFGYSATVTVCGRQVNLGAFLTAKDAAIAHDRALIRASGPCNCIDSELNYSVCSYAKDGLEKFTQYDSLLKKQLFGSSWNGPRPCDFGYLLVKTSPRQCSPGADTNNNTAADGRKSRRVSSGKNQPDSIYDYTDGSPAAAAPVLSASGGSFAEIAQAVRLKRDKHKGTSFFNQSHEDDFAPYFKSPQMQMRAEKRQRMMQLMSSSVSNNMAKSRLGLNAFRSRHSENGSVMSCDDTGTVNNSEPLGEVCSVVDTSAVRSSGSGETVSEKDEVLGFENALLCPPRSSLLDYTVDDDDDDVRNEGAGKSGGVSGQYSMDFKLQSKLSTELEGEVNSTEGDMKITNPCTVSAAAAAAVAASSVVIASCGADCESVSPATVTIVTPSSLVQQTPSNSISVIS